MHTKIHAAVDALTQSIPTQADSHKHILKIKEIAERQELAIPSTCTTDYQKYLYWGTSHNLN